MEDYFDGRGFQWFKGQVIASWNENGRYGVETYHDVALEIGSISYDALTADLKLYEPPSEGDDVMVCYRKELRDCYPGSILRATASGSIDVIFEDEDEFGFPEYRWEVQPLDYFKRPFYYQSPYPEEDEEEEDNEYDEDEEEEENEDDEDEEEDY